QIFWFRTFDPFSMILDSAVQYAAPNGNLEGISVFNEIDDEKSLATFLQFGKEFAARFEALIVTHRQLMLHELPDIADRFISLVDIKIPVHRISLAQIAACLAKLPKLRTVYLKFYAKRYFRLHSLENDQVPPAVTLPHVDQLGLVGILVSHHDLNRLHLE